MEYKRIILALPNSASESLMHSINSHSKLTCKQLFTIEPFKLEMMSKTIDKSIVFRFIKYFLSYIRNKLVYERNEFHPFRIYYPAQDYTNIANFHGDVANLDRAIFEQLTNYLKRKKNFILKQHFPPTLNNRIFFSEFKKVILVRDPLEVINKYNKHIMMKNEEFRSSIISELNLWINGWSKEKNTLIIQKNDLVLNSYKTLKQIGNFLEIEFNIDEDYKFPFINKTEL